MTAAIGVGYFLDGSDNNLATRFGPIAGPVFNVRAPAYGAVGDGVADDTAKIAAAISAASAAGGGIVLIPAGTYRVSYTALSTHGYGYAIRVPSNVTVRGVPFRSIISNGGMTTGTSTTWYDAFECPDGTTNVVFEDLRFVGQNSPYAKYSQLQMACIGVRGSTCADIEVRRCVFDDQYGFTVHNEGTGSRIHVVDCLMRNCANGLNVNADYSIQARNTLTNVESIEASGAYVHVTGNVLQACSGVSGISLGGTTGPGDVRPGIMCCDNAIVDQAGVGIAVNDGVTDSLVSRNTIVRSSKTGIQLVTGGFNAIRRVQVTHNTILDAGLATGAANDRIGIYAQDNADGMIAHNTVEYGATAGYDTTYGIVTNVGGTLTNLAIVGNRVHGSIKSVSLAAGAALRFSGNIYDPTTFEVLGATTFAGDPQRVGVVTPTYGVNITIDPLLGDVFLVTVTNANAYNFLVPAHKPGSGLSQRITIEVFNNTAGTIGAASFASGAGGYVLADAFVSPAAGVRRSITFAYNPTADRWVEVHRGVQGMALIASGTTSDGVLVDATTVLSAANKTALTGAADTTLHFHAADRARANHTGTQAASTITGATFGTGDYTFPANVTIAGVLTNNTNVVSKATTATLVASDQFVEADATAGAFTITLPTAVGNKGLPFSIIKVDSSANAVTIGTTSSQTINGVTTQALAAQWNSITVVSNGANWRAV